MKRVIIQDDAGRVVSVLAENAKKSQIIADDAPHGESGREVSISQRPDPEPKSKKNEDKTETTTTVAPA